MAGAENNNQIFDINRQQNYRHVNTVIQAFNKHCKQINLDKSKETMDAFIENYNFKSKFKTLTDDQLT